MPSAVLLSVCSGVGGCGSQGKKAVFLRFLKVAGKLFITTVSKKKCSKKSDDDNGGFQQQVPQRFVDGYDHTSSRNDR